MIFLIYVAVKVHADHQEASRYLVARVRTKGPPLGLSGDEGRGRDHSELTNRKELTVAMEYINAEGFMEAAAWLARLPMYPYIDIAYYGLNVMSVRDDLATGISHSHEGKFVLALSVDFGSSYGLLVSRA